MFFSLSVSFWHEGLIETVPLSTPNGARNWSWHVGDPRTPEINRLNSWEGERNSIQAFLIISLCNKSNITVISVLLPLASSLLLFCYTACFISSERPWDIWEWTWGGTSRTPGNPHSLPTAQKVYWTCWRTRLLHGRSLEMHSMHSWNSSRSVYRNTEGDRKAE